jgi:hypothetical protein
MVPQEDPERHDVLFASAFDLPVIYAVGLELNRETRFDGRVRASTMWFSP